ncbi:MAG: DUF3810 domain-containing protein [Lachnospiraceae bacterium]
MGIHINLHNTDKKNTIELKNKTSQKLLVIKLALVTFAVFLNILSWNSNTFSDWYITNILPLWINTYSRFISIFPVSVGEKLIILGIVLLALGVIIFILGFFKKEKLKLLRRKYWNVISWILICVLLIQTLNCFILYHASSFTSKYIDTTEENKYGFEELYNLREHIVEKLNFLSTKFERGSNGEIIFNETSSLHSECIKSMERLGKKYPSLSGYYPQPKKILFSNIMSQQYLSGIFFPFTLEANYNTDMYITNMPFTICHELAHLKGYIYEDEANFIAFMACTTSDNLFFQYSGYLNVLNYVSNDFRKNASEKEWNMRTLVTEEVAADNIFLTQDAWEKVNKTSPFNTETVETISNKLLDGNLKLNGIKDGIKSYSRVVQLLIYYYS